MDLSVRRTPEFPELPRFGIRMFLKKEMDEVSYYGVGPMESYVDKHRAGSHGKYIAKVSDMHEDYLRPQENGSHWDCDYVDVYKRQLYCYEVLRTFKYFLGIYPCLLYTSRCV